MPWIPIANQMLYIEHLCHQKNLGKFVFKIYVKARQTPNESP
jgi:hypothetical protein